MKIEFEVRWPRFDFLRAGWNSRQSHVRRLEREIRRLEAAVQKSPRPEDLQGVGAYWARKATTEITWNVILWHIRQRVTAKRRTVNTLAPFAETPTEDEAADIFREMWRKPPVFAPPAAAKALTESIIALHTKQAA